MDNEKEQQMTELETLAMPIVEFLKEKGNPHQTIMVTSESIKLVSDDYSIPVNIIE